MTAKEFIDRLRVKGHYDIETKESKEALKIVLDRIEDDGGYSLFSIIKSLNNQLGCIIDFLPKEFNNIPISKINSLVEKLERIRVIHILLKMVLEEKNGISLLPASLNDTQTSI